MHWTSQTLLNQEEAELEDSMSWVVETSESKWTQSPSFSVPCWFSSSTCFSLEKAHTHTHTQRMCRDMTPLTGHCSDLTLKLGTISGKHWNWDLHQALTDGVASHETAPCPKSSLWVCCGAWGHLEHHLGTPSSILYLLFGILLGWRAFCFPSFIHLHVYGLTDVYFIQHV